jgi:NAD(P)-dependent dehydrogenase (short-subunit alcohol dehydrogenase family)
LLTAAYIVYALDRLEEPSPDFARVQTRAVDELGTSLSYRRIDVREVDALNAIVEEISDRHQRLDGLVAAAAIQQETPALEYTAADCDRMLGINVTGCFMTAQAAARQMIRFGNGGSIVLIASMSASIANRVCCLPSPNFLFFFSPVLQTQMLMSEGTYMPGLQRVQSGRASARSKLG